LSLKPKIVMVDDDVTLPEIVGSSELMSGYEMVAIHSGLEALQKIEEGLSADMFILDYNMPEMNGIELCRKIKQTKIGNDVPIIFLTGSTDTREIVDAFKAGAVDYLIKPIVMEELSVRVKTHLGLYFAKKKIEEFARDMEKLAEERARQLVHADRLATIGTLSAGLAHEIKNPTTFISGNVQTLEKFWAVLSKAMEEKGCNCGDDERLKFIYEEMPSLIAGIKDGVVRIRKVVDSLKAFSRKETTEKIPFSIADRIETALTLCHKALKNRVLVEKRLPEKELIVKGDPQQIEQVLINLFINAADAMEGMKDARLLIDVSNSDDSVFIIVEDNGPGLEDDKLEKIWEPFFTTKPAGKGTGLGLPICRSIIEGHGGIIDVERAGNGGLRFKIELPLWSH